MPGTGTGQNPRDPLDSAVSQATKLCCWETHYLPRSLGYWHVKIQNVIWCQPESAMFCAHLFQNWHKVQLLPGSRMGPFPWKIWSTLCSFSFFWLPLQGALLDWLLLPLLLPLPHLHGCFGLPLLIMVIANFSGTLMLIVILVFTFLTVLKVMLKESSNHCQPSLS